VQWDDLVPLLRAGRITPPIGSTHPLADAAAALAEIDERRATGKVVLEVR
jgi:NADPH2:quinone reductase